MNKESPEDLIEITELLKFSKIGEKSIETLIKSNYFKKIYSINGKSMISKIDFENLKNQLESHMTVSEINKLFNYKYIGSLHHLFKVNNISPIFKLGSNNYYDKKIVEKFYKKVKAETIDTFTVDQTVKLLNLSNSKAVVNLIHQGFLKNAYKGLYKRWCIPHTDIENYVSFIKNPMNLEKDILNEHEALIYLNFPNITNLFTLINSNYFPGAYLESSTWKIPKIDLDNYLDKVRNLEINKSPHVIDTPHFKTYTLEELKSKILIDYNILESEKQLKTKINSNLIFVKEKEFINLINHIFEIYNNEFLGQTTLDYIQFCHIQINKLSGSEFYNLQRVTNFKNLYLKLHPFLDTDIFKTSTNKINLLFEEDSILSVHQQKIFSNFLRYYYETNNIIPPEIRRIKNKYSKDKNIYSPQEFNILYKFTINHNIHIENAINNVNYANMWVYTLLLLTDFIRGQDIIDNTPPIDFEESTINSIEWFKYNELNDKQINYVINQIFSAFRHKRTKKTNELLTFVISPDIRYPLSIALIISEFHRRTNNYNLLLESFIVGKYKKYQTEGKTSHLHFFKSMENSKFFHFGSQKLNNSTATYLFYSISENDNEDSELALYLTQNARSHKSADSTAIYIQSTNSDGSINKVAYNLFKRGYFGWLYNSLIDFNMNFEKAKLNMIEKTDIIVNLREEFTPIYLEQLSKYINLSITNTISHHYDNNFESIINNIKNKQQSVLEMLSNYEKDEISKILKKLASSELPAKVENAQCLIYPNCKYPHNINACYSCEYIIPGNLLLIQLKNELHYLIDEIKDLEDNIMLIKYSKFLLDALFIWKQARLHFGENYVEAYIDINSISKELKDNAHKINLTSI